MLKPDRVIERELKRYCKDLSLKWNNKEKYWEVWIKMAWGDRLVTPVVETLYNHMGSAHKFVPLDNRIIDWIYYADTQSNRVQKNWKWLSDIKLKEKKAANNLKFQHTLSNIAKEHYNMINSETIDVNFYNPQDDEEWLRPDIQSKCTSRMMLRSADNAKKSKEIRKLTNDNA